MGQTFNRLSQEIDVFSQLDLPSRLDNSLAVWCRRGNRKGLGQIWCPMALSKWKDRWNMSGFFLFLRFIFFNDFIYLFLERREGKEKERERNINVWLPPTHPLPGTWPLIQACALTRNQTGNPLVCRPVLNPLSYTSQSYILLINLFLVYMKWEFFFSEFDIHVKPSSYCS